MCFFNFSDLFIVTNKKDTCTKSIIDNLFLMIFLRAVNSFFCLEMIDTFSLISCFNNCLWQCLYGLEKRRLLLATLKLRNFGVKLFNCSTNYFSFKDVVPEPLRSCQIYNFTCGSCNASYIGKTFRHMKVRVSEHQGVSPRTGKHLKGTLSTSVRDHMLDCNHVVAWDDFKVLGRESNHWLLEIKESLFIKRDRPSLNKNIYSQELFLF